MGSSVGIVRDSTAHALDGSLLKLFEDTLRCEYYEGGVDCLVRPHTTGWRTLPFALVAQNVYGWGRLETMDATYEGGNGDAACLPAGIRHRCTLLSEDTIARWVHIRFVVLGSIDVFTLFPPRLRWNGPLSVRIGDINESLVRIMEKPQRTFDDVVQQKILGFELLRLLLTDVAISDHASQVLDAQRLLPACEYIHEHIHENISLTKLARLVDLSPSRFSVVFRACFGMPPRDYILGQRMRKAQELLLSTVSNIAEVAEQVGYSSQFQFSRVFKRISGTPPSQYRDQVLLRRI